MDPPRIDLASPGVSRQNLTAWIEWLSSPRLAGRHAGEAGADATAAVLASQMAAFGLTSPAAGYCRGFELLGGPDYNVVGLAGPTAPASDSPVVLLGAHYDGQGMHPAGAIYPGADDNASGLAALLEVARLVTRQRPSEDGARTSAIGWVFAALGAEEVGQVGSRAYLAAPSLDPSRIRLMINLDMVGRPWPGERRRAIGYQAMGPAREATVSALDRAAELAGVEVRPLAGLGELAPTISDARVFAARMPTLLLSTALHEDHHQLTDVPERIDYGQIERTVQLVLTLADILADRR